MHDYTPIVCQPPLCLLSGSEVHVWSASVGAFSPVMGTLHDLLSADEQGKAGRFAQDQRQRQYIVGRGLLRVLLSGYLDRPTQEIAFSRNPYGKPSVDGCSWLNFNISHSDDVVAFAFARNRNLGIDVQKLNAHDVTPAIADRVFAPHELSGFGKLDEYQKQIAFSRTWAVKEAYIKGIGCGLSQPLNDLEVSFTNREQPRIRVRGKQDSHTSQWELRELSLADGYAAALAVEGRGWRLTSRSIDVIPEWQTSLNIP